VAEQHDRQIGVTGRDVLVELLRQPLVAGSVLGRAMGDLHDAPGDTVGEPAVYEDIAVARRRQIERVGHAGMLPPSSAPPVSGRARPEPHRKPATAAGSHRS
jgi:hypothetical protein